MRNALHPVRLALAASLVAVPLAAHEIPTWTRTIDQSSTGAGDIAWTLVRDPSSGRLYVGGWYQTQSAPDAHQGFVAAFDAGGSELWTRTVPAPPGRNGFVYRVAPHPSGGVVTLGQDTDAALGDPDVRIARLDAAGSVVWALSWDGPAGSIDDADDLFVDPDGSVRVAARTWSNAAADLVSQLLVVDANGASVQALPVPPSGATPSAGGRIARAANGDVLFAQTDRLLRLTPGGSELWSTAIAAGHARPSLVVDAQDEVTVASALSISPTELPVFHVQRFDATGAPRWSRTLTEPGLPGGMANGLTTTSQGAVVAVGFLSTSFSSQTFEVRGAAVAYAADGTELWRRSTGFDGLAIDELSSVAAASNGDVAVAGRTRDETTGILRPLVARLGRDGGTVWARELDELTMFTPGPPTVGVVSGTEDEVYAATTRPGTSSTEVDAVLTRFDTSAIATCSGDGSASACPCGNEAAFPTVGGCRNSLGLSARLDAAGSTSLANDTWTLTATGLPPSTSALFFQGTSAIPGGTSFGDGLRCTGGTVIRLGTRTSTLGTVTYPGPLDPPVSLRGGVAGPGVRHYQVWYRNAAAFCTSATFNLTNALRGLWVP